MVKLRHLNIVVIETYPLVTSLTATTLLLIPFYVRRQVEIATVTNPKVLAKSRRHCSDVVTNPKVLAKPRLNCSKCDAAIAARSHTIIAPHE